jgi:uncharacterized protein (TIGR03032 family)
MAELRISILVSTYQWDRLVILSHDQGERVISQCRFFHMPMGLALRKDRLAIGTSGVIQEYRNLPSAVSRVDPTSTCDAAYLPRSIHATGKIDIHEMDWGGPAGDELWFVNTLFSCLCTRSRDFSFVPRWRPKFVTAPEPEDRCHLNGFCMIDGAPAYVTALGETDTEGGWRANKKSGGILIDTRTSEIIGRGLSMPHSPRWHQDKLLLLEAGNGGIGAVDPSSGRYEPIAILPGFTRGLDFFGHYAFIGLSLPRKLSIYNDLSVMQLPPEKAACGVWVVDLRSGETVAFAKFQGTVREVFSVAVLPEYQHPDVITSDVKLLADSFVFPGQKPASAASGAN